MTGAVDDRWAERPSRGGFEVSRLDRVGERAAAVGVGLLIVTGFASSYTTLRDLAVEVGGFSPWLAPVVPLSFDLGIVVLSLKVVLAARRGRDARVLRVLVLLLSAATVVANGAASSTAVGRLLHAVPPAMFVVCFETLTASARHDAHIARAPARTGPASNGEALPVLTAKRLLLAPRQTWSIWRARVLSVPPTTPTASPAMTAHASQDASERSRPGHWVADSGGFTPPPTTSRGWPVDELFGPSAAVETGVARRPARAAHRSAADSAGPGFVGNRDRLTEAVEALRADPAMTAVALAGHLGGAGHRVSVRTAQRIRHQAGQRLEAEFTGALLPGGPGGRPE